ncbi:MAG TPA: S8 family serine peptidase, partial [Aggregatilineales bacterium]|nr:S8 family serine peptidase [Aggregatilineales bacterium]
GHGTHVAGISAGYGVSGSTTYPGPWDNTTPFGTLNPSPGYAPRAALLGMRVFGCSGSTTSVQVIAAINDAAAGFVATDPAVTFPAADVVNMSLGSQLGYGGDDATLNPYTGAIANAMATGTIIVMSAGNNSDTHFITGSPGSSPAGISVASIIHGNYNAITVGGTGANGNYPVQQSVSSPMVPPPVGPYPLAQPAGNGCLAADYSAFPTNSISIVTFTGGCGSAVLMASAQASPNTPRGLLVISNVPGQFQNLACSGGGPYIPCVSLQPATGTFLLANIATATVIMDASLRASAANLAGVASAFTSRGPSRQSSGGLKPDIASTGDGILSAASGQTAAPYSASNSGTSMSSPSVAGMIATILSNPTYNSWTPAQIKALIMNTATTVANVNDAFGNPNPMVRYGAGVANTFSAIQNQVIVYNTARPDVVSLTFGTVNAVMNGTATVRTADLTVRNLSSNTATYNVSWVGVSNQAGVTVTASPSSISVAPGATTTVTVTLTANFTGIATPHANTDPTRGSPPFLQVGNPRHWMSETTGYVSFSPTSGAAGVNQALRLNVYANARPASDMSAPDTLTSNTLSGTINIPLTGNSINSGAAYPNDIISMVTALRLMGEDPAGDTAFNAPWGDIRYVGVSNDANGNITGTRFVYFGISVEGELSTPQPQGFQAVIYFDYNGDDILDSCSFNTSPASGTSRTDVFINYLAPGCGSGFGQNWLNDYAASVADSYVFSNNVYVLPVRLSGAGTTLGRSNATPAFRFQIELYSEFELMDVFPNDGSWIDYNPNQPIYSFNSTGELDGNALQMPAYFDDASTTIPMTYDLSTFTGTTPPGILLFHHHNGTVTNRPEIILFGVTGAGGIQVTHSVPANVDVGALFNFTATVTNLGTTDALNVVLTDALPIAAAVQLQAPLPAGCTAAGQDVTCTVGTLAAGESRSFVFPVRGMGNYTVTALASATTTSQDLDPTDNTNIPATVTIGYGSGGTGTAGGPGTGPLSLPSTGYEPAPTSVDMAVLIGGIVAGLLLLGGVFVWRRRR